MAPLPGSDVSPDSHEAKQNKQKCCLGALYFSESMNGQGKTPVCGGVRQTIGSAQDLSTLQTETVPPGQFRYLCVGYSMYNETRLRERQANAQRAGQAEDVELPYCEGLEVISAAALQRKPVLLEEGGAPMGQDSGAADQGSRDGQPRDRRFVAPPGMEGGIRLDEFPERFARTARKIVDKMGSNAGRIVVSVKRTADRVQEGLWGRNGDA